MHSYMLKADQFNYWGVRKWNQNNKWVIFEMVGDIECREGKRLKVEGTQIARAGCVMVWVGTCRPTPSQAHLSFVFWSYGALKSLRRLHFLWNLGPFFELKNFSRIRVNIFMFIDFIRLTWFDGWKLKKKCKI